MWEVLANTMRNSADWRRGMAQRHPEDADRNLHASTLLDRLADEVETITDLELAQSYADACGEDDLVQLSEVEQEEIRLVGFSSEPESGRAFVAGILARMSQ